MRGKGADCSWEIRFFNRTGLPTAPEGAAGKMGSAVRAGFVQTPAILPFLARWPPRLRAAQPPSQAQDKRQRLPRKHIHQRWRRPFDIQLFNFPRWTLQKIFNFQHLPHQISAY